LSGVQKIVKLKHAKRSNVTTDLIDHHVIFGSIRKGKSL